MFTAHRTTNILLAVIAILLALLVVKAPMPGVLKEAQAQPSTLTKSIIHGCKYQHVGAQCNPVELRVDNEGR